MKSVWLLILAAAVGLIGGASAHRAYTHAELQALMEQNQQLEREAEDLRAQVKLSAVDQAFLADYGEEANAEGEDIEVALDALEGPHSVEPEGDVFDSEEEKVLDLMALLNLEEPLPRVMMGTTQLAQNDPGESQMPGQEHEEGTATDPELAQRQARQRAAAEKARQELLNYLNELAANSADPLERERLGVLADYYDAIFDVRRQMQDAETDAQREELREALRQNVSEVNALMRTQQNHMLQQVARQFGVSGPGRQRRFTNTLRETYHSPFFTLAPSRRAPR